MIIRTISFGVLCTAQVAHAAALPFSVGDLGCPSAIADWKDKIVKAYPFTGSILGTTYSVTQSGYEWDAVVPVGNVESWVDLRMPYAISLDCNACKLVAKKEEKRFLAKGWKIRKSLELTVALSENRRKLLVNGGSYKFGRAMSMSDEFDSVQTDVISDLEGRMVARLASEPRRIPVSGTGIGTNVTEDNMAGPWDASFSVNPLDLSSDWENIDFTPDFSVRLWREPDGTLEITHIFTKSPYRDIYNTAFNYIKMQEFEDAQEARWRMEDHDWDQGSEDDDDDDDDLFDFDLDNHHGDDELR